MGEVATLANGAPPSVSSKLALGRSTCQHCWKVFRNESGNVQAVAIFYFLASALTLFYRATSVTCYCVQVYYRALLFNTFRYHYVCSNCKNNLCEIRVVFSVKFHTVTKFHQPSHDHVINRGIFAPHLCKVAAMKYR
jgi:hypothetical protein